MALNIYQQINDITLLHSDNYITVNTDKAALYNDFKFLVNIYQFNSGETTAIVNQLSQLPNPNSFLILNPSELFDIDNYIDTSVFNYHNYSYKKGIIYIIEFYNNNEYDNLYSDSFIIINGEENYELSEFDYKDYELSSNTSKFLTDYRDKRYFDNTSNNYISMLNSSGDTSINLDVKNNFFVVEYIDNNNNKYRNFYENENFGDKNKIRLDINLRKDLIESQTPTISQIWQLDEWTNSGNTILLNENLFETNSTNFSRSYGSIFNINKDVEYTFKINLDIIDDIDTIWVGFNSGLTSIIGDLDQSVELEKINGEQYLTIIADDNYSNIYIQGSGNTGTIFINSFEVIEIKVNKNIFTDIKRFYFYTSDENYIQTSEKLTFIKDNRCNYNEKKEIIWNNRFGGVESFKFFGNILDEFEVNKDYFEKTKYDINTNTGKLIRNYNDKNLYTNNKEIEQNYILSSDYIDNSYNILMKDLLKSTNVILFENNIQIPIIISTNKLDKYSDIKDNLKNYQMKYMKNIRKKYKKF
jgi:hypothetical protein